MSRTAVIIPAAGSGSRMESSRPKQFLELGSRPVLIHTLLAFFDSGLIDVLVLPVAKAWQEETRSLLHRYLTPDQYNNIIITTGGATRQQSVLAGLRALPDEVDLVLVHDAARPLVSTGIIEDCLTGARQNGAAIAAIPVNDTLKKVDERGKIRNTVSRNRLYRAQTPQAARRHLLEKAFARAEDEDFQGTDEASLLEHAGIPVAIVAGEEKNIKITRPGDLQIVHGLMQESTMLRIGHGFDAHRLVSDRPLILGGEKIEYHLGLQGHSDADVLVHALIDAMLGALALGDIGTHFPDTDKQYRNINSLHLLERVMQLVHEKGFRLVNADLTLLCQQPKIAPHITAMRANLARTCETGISAISIKATTTEKMGYTGRGEGIAAQAVVLLERRP